MKKLLTLLCTLAATISVSAEEYSGNCGKNDSSGTSVSWSLDTETGVLAVTGSGEMKEYTNTNPDNSDCAPWLSYKTSITSITIGNGVTSIGDYAFYSLPNLTSVTFPESGFTNIGMDAFCNCTRLESISIPSTVTTIENRAFYSCTALKSIEVPSSVTTLGTSVFSGCSMMASAVINNNVIGEREFDRCTALSSVKFKGSPSEIPTCAFNYCQALKSIKIPSSVISISTYAFADCSNLTTVWCDCSTAPAIASNSFPSKSILKNVCINGSEGVLTSYTSAEVWKDYNFTYFWTYNDRNILAYKTADGISFKNVTCSGTNLTIGDNKDYCAAEDETQVCVYLNNPVLNEDGDVIYNITAIGERAFYFAKFSDLRLPSTLTTIGNYAFDNATIGNALDATFTVPTGVTSIGDYAFGYCTMSKDVTLPSTLSTLGDHAFFNSTITSVNVPASLTTFGAHAFGRCGSLTSLTIEDGLKTISEKAFESCAELTSVSIPASVTSIDKGGFWECEGLTSVTLNNGLKTIGEIAFEYCTALETVSIPASVTIIDKNGFSCSGLKSVTLNEGLKTLGLGAFWCCSGLTQITVPASVEEINSAALYCANADITLQSIPRFIKENDQISSSKSVNLNLTDNSYIYTGSETNYFPTLNTASYTRTMPNTWGTVVLPFEVESDANVAYYGITGLSNDNVLTISKYETLPAGTPALVKKLSGDGIAASSTSATSSKTVTVSTQLKNAGEAVIMKGAYAKTQVTDANAYYIADNKFYMNNQYFYINKLRAYFTTTQPTAAKMLAICDDATAIDALVNDSADVKIVAIYDGAGVVRSELGNGLNIVKLSNGKTQKILVK